MEYRHNILNTARESTLPNSIVDIEEGATNISTISHVGSLPNLHSFSNKPKMNRRAKGSKSTRNLSRNDCNNSGLAKPSTVDYLYK